jgi:hypothetical protein
MDTRNPKEQEVRQKYVEKLDKVEDQIGTLRARILEAQDKKTQLEKQLIQIIQEYKEE